MSGAGSTLMVVVLYRAAGSGDSVLADAETLRCLEAACVKQPECLAPYSVLLWDNSPLPWDDRELSFPYEYRHAATEGVPNDGVSGGYNAALQVCLQRGLRWMLLLDQDTHITADFLAGMSRHLAAVEGDERIAAVAPLLLEGDFQLSPQRVVRYGFRPVAPEPSRILDDRSFAANSGVSLRASALQAIGGYSLDFWLDHSDIEMFERLYAAGKRIFLAADLRLQHSMTMLDYDGRMTPERYGNFLAAEQAFFDLYRDGRQNVVQVLRLAGRVWRQRRYRDPIYTQMTRRFLLRRLVTSKASRLRQWRERRLERHAVTAGV